MMSTNNTPFTVRKTRYLRLNITYSFQKEFTLNRDELKLLKSSACFICDDCFTSIQEVFKHLRDEHGVFNCLVCRELYGSQNDLEAHLRETHIVFFCTSCSFLGNLGNYEIHKKSRCTPSNSRIIFYKTNMLLVNQANIGPGLKCTLCSVTVPDLQSMEVHSRTCHGLGSAELFNYKLINIPPNSIKNIVKTVDLNFLKGQFSDLQLTLCGFCKLSCDNFSGLEYHLKRRHYHFPCSLCTYSATNETSLREHVNTKHGIHRGSVESFDGSANKFKATNTSSPPNSPDSIFPMCRMLQNNSQVRNRDHQSQGWTIPNLRDLKFDKTEPNGIRTAIPDLMQSAAGKPKLPEYPKPLCTFSKTNVPSLDYYASMDPTTSKTAIEALAKPAGKDEPKASSITPTLKTLKYTPLALGKPAGKAKPKASSNPPTLKTLQSIVLSKNFGPDNQTSDSPTVASTFCKKLANPEKKTKVNSNLLECHVCKFTGKTAAAFVEHYRARHELPFLNKTIQSRLTCQQCTYSTTFRLRYYQHIETKHKLYTCRLCEATFETPEDLMNHIQVTCNPFIHSNFKACDVCFTLDDPEWYLEHLRCEHLGDFKILVCIYCDYTVNDKKRGRLDFNEHLKICHGLYSCDICHVEYISIEELIKHINIFAVLKFE